MSVLRSGTSRRVGYGVIISIAGRGDGQMPYLLKLTAQLDGEEPPLAEHVHAMVSTWVEGGESLEVHRANVKPFRCGAVDWDLSGRTSIRVGLLNDALLSRLSGRAANGAATIRLGRQRGSLRRTQHGELAAQVEHASWTNLLDASSPRSEFSFRFVGPTVFRSGRDFLPQPFPGLVFGHLRARWSAFAPPRLRPEIDVKSVGLVAVRSDLATVMTATRRGPVPSFVGDVTFRATGGSDRDLRVLDALARLTPFAGIGANTTYGMGEARYVSSDPAPLPEPATSDSDAVAPAGLVSA